PTSLLSLHDALPIYQVSTPQSAALVVEATGVADRDGRPYLASSSAFSMPGMPAGSPAWHFSTAVLASRLWGCCPLLELMSRYCSDRKSTRLNSSHQI